MELHNNIDKKYFGGLIEAMCLDGSCYELAVALHKNTDLPLVGVWSPAYINDNGSVGSWRHAAVRNGINFIDARGIVTGRELIKPFEHEDWLDIRDITVDDLLSIRPINNTETIERIIQGIWPDLPWNDKSHHKKCLGFLEELEQLSQKHNIWIRSETSSPVYLSYEEDETPHYKASILETGIHIGFNREYS